MQAGGDSSSHVTEDELDELKYVLKDLEETDPDKCCQDNCGFPISQTGCCAPPCPDRILLVNRRLKGYICANAER